MKKLFRKHKKRKIIAIVVLLVVLLIGGIYGSILWKFYGGSVGVVSKDKVDTKSKKVKIAKEERKDEDVFNVLLVGTDSRDPDADRGRSDSMMMVSFNKKEGKSTVISFLLSFTSTIFISSEFESSLFCTSNLFIISCISSSDKNHVAKY